MALIPHTLGATTLVGARPGTRVHLEADQIAKFVQRLVGERIGRGWRETVRRKIGRLETCTHLAELLGPAVTTLFQTMSYGKRPDGGDSMDGHLGTSEPPFFIDGCHSWRTDGPIVAKVFPQFATKPRTTD